MAEAHANHHPYHLVDPSPWPVVGAVSAFVAGARRASPSCTAPARGCSLPGVLGVLYTMLVWWRDVIKEAHEGYHTPVVQLGLRYGMILFIASEVMFFVAWFWAFFDSSLSADSAIQVAKVAVHRRPLAAAGHRGLRPVAPAAAEHADPADLGHDGHLGASRAAPRRPPGLIWGLVCTILLGLTFTSVQAYEYAHAPFSFGGNIYGSTFFMATGFHGFHVIVGTIFLIVCLIRARARRLHARSSISASRRPPGTGTSSTWSGCSCSSASTSGAAGALRSITGDRPDRSRNCDES